MPSAPSSAAATASSGSASSGGRRRARTRRPARPQQRKRRRVDSTPRGSGAPPQQAPARARLRAEEAALQQALDALPSLASSGLCDPTVSLLLLPPPFPELPSDIASLIGAMACARFASVQLDKPADAAAAGVAVGLSRHVDTLTLRTPRRRDMVSTVALGRFVSQLKGQQKRACGVKRLFVEFELETCLRGRAPHLLAALFGALPRLECVAGLALGVADARALVDGLQARVAAAGTLRELSVRIAHRQLLRVLAVGLLSRPDAVLEFLKLRFTSVDSTPGDSDAFGAFADALQANSSVTQLCLQECGSVAASMLPPALAGALARRTRPLERLSVNYLGACAALFSPSAAFHPVVEAISTSQPQSLRSLILHLPLRAASAPRFAPVLRQLPALQELRVRLVGDPLPELLDGFCPSNGSMDALELIWDDVPARRDRVAAALCALLRRARPRECVLCCWSFEGAAAVSVVKALGECATLSRLRLTFNGNIQESASDNAVMVGSGESSTFMCSWLFALTETLRARRARGATPLDVLDLRGCRMYACEPKLVAGLLSHPLVDWHSKFALEDGLVSRAPYDGPYPLGGAGLWGAMASDLI